MSNNLQTKEEFLSRLRYHLRRLPKEEIDSALIYYEEYLEDAGEENLRGTLDALGTPREVAVQILKDKAFRDIETSPPSAKKGATAVWMAILAIFASPIALPLAIAAATVVLTFAIVLLIFALTFVTILFIFVAAFCAASIAFLLGGIVCVCISFPLFFQHIATGFYYLGAGMAMAGFGLVTGLGTAYLARLCWRGIRELFGRRLPRMVAAVFSRRSVQ